MIPYQLGDRDFDFSYRKAREAHLKFVDMTDEKFLEKLPQALHLAVFICWVKEAHAQACLRDDGLIHELVHLLVGDPPVHQDGLHGVRRLFDEYLELA